MIQRVLRVSRACAAVLCVVLFTACDSDGEADNPIAPGGTESGVDARGMWEGTFAVETCTGSGSVEDLTCRQRFPSGTSILMTLVLSGSVQAPTGTLTLGEMSGHVDGMVSSSGELSLDGSVSDDPMVGDLTVQLTAWDTQLQNDTMVGTFSFRSTSHTLPGDAEGTARIRVLGRVS